VKLLIKKLGVSPKYSKHINTTYRRGTGKLITMHVKKSKGIL
jgi:hypothetical protein